MKPLDGAQLKIVRAQQHLDCLNTEIRAYLDSKPYRFPLTQNQKVIATGNAAITSEPPLMLGCIFGDCLSNLRTSLDYIAWELATKYATTEANKNARTSLQFPIQKNATHFADNAGAKLKNLSFPTAAIDLIESVQPYNAGYESLGLLNDLVNADKHRLPLLAIARAETNSIVMNLLGVAQIRVEFSDTPFAGAVPAVPLDPASAEGSRAMNVAREAASEASGPMRPIQPSRYVAVDGDVEVFVSLKNAASPNEPVGVTLTKIFKCVSDIIPRFESFLV